MTKTRCKLPFKRDALEPYMSSETLQYHYGKHHKAYADKLASLTEGTEYAGLELEDIIETARRKGDDEVFNNAAQVWNHNFFWRSVSPNGGNPDGRIRDIVEKYFNSYDEFKTAFRTAAAGLFGSGWVWLVLDRDELRIVTTSNADTPVGAEQTPLMTLDVWEHAYYLDYQNRRKDFADAFLDHLVNWNFVAANLDAASVSRAA